MEQEKISVSKVTFMYTEALETLSKFIDQVSEAAEVQHSDYADEWLARQDWWQKVEAVQDIVFSGIKENMINLISPSGTDQI